MTLGSDTCKQELHIFSDASTEAIASVAYVRSVGGQGNVEVRFLMGNAKVAPRAATTVPRLELCAALSAAEMAYDLSKELKAINFDSINFYTDSAVVLGYLRSETRCFTKYITRRVEAIHRLTGDKEWRFVATERNPADVATRPHTAEQLLATSWLSGPSFLYEEIIEFEEPISNSSTLPETVTPNVKVFTCSAPDNGWMVKLTKRRSSWRLIVGVVRVVVAGTLRWLDKARQRLGISLAPRAPEMDFRAAEMRLFRMSQRISFPEFFNGEGEIRAKQLEDLPDKHPMKGLTPQKGKDRILRAGGRLRNSVSPFEERHPIILSSKCPIVFRFAVYMHNRTPHQGRMISHYSIRNSGVFILGGKSLVGKIVDDCDMCKRLRGPCASQLMADLPEERVAPSAVFDHVGVDVFGPYYVHDGRSTRGKQKSICTTRELHGVSSNTRGAPREHGHVSNDECFKTLLQYSRNMQINNI